MAGKKYTLRQSRKADTTQILGLVNDEAERTGALLHIKSDQLNRWISNRMSFVAETTEEGKRQVIAHEAAHLWPKSGIIELRSSVVKPEYRGKGISSALSMKLIAALRKRYRGSTAIAFTNKAGSGKGILHAMGFHEISHKDLPAEVFTIGSKHRGKTRYGYHVFSAKV